MPFVSLILVGTVVVFTVTGITIYVKEKESQRLILEGETSPSYKIEEGKQETELIEINRRSSLYDSEQIREYTEADL